MANFIAANYDTVCHRIHHARAANAADIMQGVSDRLGQDIRDLQDSLRRNPQYQLGLTQLINEKCHELADIQTRAAQTQVDVNENVSYKFLLDEAVAPDKKAYPKRAVIVALGTLGAVVMCILVLLCMDAVKPKDEQEQA
jgi:LPS O-antigen subunit length determinant protein (WzzB/FepE family)